ncbi:MAG: DUF4139 domain-containing protein [Treponema sp.]|nr:DUF4139 domain-containing protein [Treponema sp.]
MRINIALIALCAFFSGAGQGIWAQGIRESSVPDADIQNANTQNVNVRSTGTAVTDAYVLSEGQIPLKRVVILSSGLAYYEHSGAIEGEARISLPFRTDAVNDALKSLVINDPSSANPSISYQSENTLFQTLRSLSIDLSDNPDLAVILSRLRGVEAEITAPTVFSGRIVGIEHMQTSISPYSITAEPWLLLSTSAGLKRFNLKDISTISFKDPVIEQDLTRALDLIASSRNSFSRQLDINLPGNAANSSRNVSISYVIPSPVWKVSYRLDIGTDRPLLQGWAIVDNDSDTDWNNIELSLVAGRPSSFIQNLYPPYYVSRPVLPLSIAGTAEAVTHDQSYGAVPAPARAENRMMMDMMVKEEVEAAYSTAARQSSVSGSIAGGTVQTASGSEAGGQFEFTIKNPVTLNRRMSAMLPLVESNISARKLIIYSNGKHPRLGAELTNTSGMKLPAGPVTVYDGVYAGDALIEFWNENEKRFISFGEDLSVTAVTGDTVTRDVRAVNITRGVMTITRSLAYIKTYTFINSDSVSKQLVAEHAKSQQTSLVSPNADEQTESSYRFNLTLPAKGELVFNVTEERPIQESVRLLSIHPDSFLSYSSNMEIPANVRDALRRAIELRQAAERADTAVREIETQRTRLFADQDRIRRNLEAAGNQTQQGQEYLRRLVALDGEIDAISPALEKAQTEAKTARESYENYLNGLDL